MNMHIATAALLNIPVSVPLYRSQVKELRRVSRLEGVSAAAKLLYQLENAPDAAHREFRETFRNWKGNESLEHRVRR